MDYLQEAFGNFNPQVDQDAAVKFALNIILMDERLSELSCLITDGHEIGGVEGEPGWIIERRDRGSSGDHPFYADWPKNAHFHVHVEPSAFELAHPDMFMEMREFHCYIRKAVDAYLARNPSQEDAVQLVISKLKKQS